MRQRQLAILVTLTLTICGALQVADPATLGLPERVPAWAGLAATALGYLASVLPPVQRAEVDGD